MATAMRTDTPQDRPLAEFVAGRYVDVDMEVLRVVAILSGRLPAQNEICIEMTLYVSWHRQEPQGLHVNIKEPAVLGTDAKLSNPNQNKTKTKPNQTKGELKTKFLKKGIYVTIELGYIAILFTCFCVLLTFFTLYLHALLICILPACFTILHLTCMLYPSRVLLS